MRQDAALPAPRAGQERFGAPGKKRARQMLPGRDFGAPGSKVGAPDFKIGAPSSIAALPAPRAGQGPSFTSRVRSWESANTLFYFFGFLAR